MPTTRRHIDGIRIKTRQTTAALPPVVPTPPAVLPLPPVPVDTIPNPFQSHRKPKKTARTVSAVASFAIAAVCVYFIAAPFLPYLQIAFYRLKTQPAHLDITAPVSTVNGATITLASVPNSQPNHLTVPVMGVDADILEGETEDVLDRGIWHRPLSSTPDAGSNTVLAAHRFKYLSGPNTFFYLDKVQANDIVTINWLGKTYQYKVYATSVVPTTEVSIEDPTPDPELTLYTCTPLWTSKQRLVVKARLVQ